MDGKLDFWEPPFGKRIVKGCAQALRFSAIIVGLILLSSLLGDSSGGQVKTFLEAHMVPEGSFFKNMILASLYSFAVLAIFVPIVYALLCVLKLFFTEKTWLGEISEKLLHAQDLVFGFVIDRLFISICAIAIFIGLLGLAELLASSLAGTNPAGLPSPKVAYQAIIGAVLLLGGGALMWKERRGKPVAKAKIRGK